MLSTCHPKARPVHLLYSCQRSFRCLPYATVALCPILSGSVYKVILFRPLVSLSLSIYLSTYSSVSIYLCLSIYLSIYLSISLFLSNYLYLSIYLSLSFYLTISLSAFVLLGPSIYPCLSLSFCLVSLYLFPPSPSFLTYIISPYLSLSFSIYITSLSLSHTLFLLLSLRLSAYLPLCFRPIFFFSFSLLPLFSMYKMEYITSSSLCLSLPLSLFSLLFCVISLHKLPFY